MTFSEYLRRRPATGRLLDPGASPDGGGYRSAVGPSRDDFDPLAERSMFRGVFRAVNPARPASPVNSRLLSSPFRKRFKSQVVGP